MAAKTGNKTARRKRRGSSFERVLKELHDLLRDVDGLHADQALDELCKLVRLVKRAEAGGATGRRKLGRAKGEASAAHVGRLRRWDADLAGDGTDATLTLSDAALVEAVERLGAVALGELKGDVKGKAFQGLLSPLMRAGLGQYFTPEPVVRMMVRAVGLQPDHRVLDPFAGSGTFLSACQAALKAGPARRWSAQRLEAWSAAHLWGIEKSARMVRLGRTRLGLQSEGTGRLIAGDALAALEQYPDLPAGSVDLVLTNPPFGAQLGREGLAGLPEYELAAGRARVPLEVLAIERCLQWLKPGGRLAIVIPDGLLSNRNTRYVRRWLGERVTLRALVSLPLQTFTPYGANIKTSVLFARKLVPGEAPADSAPVQLLRVDDVGWDATGRRQPGSELARAGKTLAAFLDREVGFTSQGGA